MIRLGSVAAFCALVLVTAGCGGGLARPRGLAPQTGVCKSVLWPPGCRSPDGRWSVYLSGGDWPSVYLRGHKTTIRAYNGRLGTCCWYFEWVKPHRLLFYGGLTMRMIDPPNRQRTLNRPFNHYVVSPNGKWLAGWSQYAIAQQTVQLVSLDRPLGTCRYVQQGLTQSDSALGFTRNSADLYIKRRQPSGTRILKLPIRALATGC